MVMGEYEIMLVKQHLASWNTARFIARLIIAFEIAMGILLLAHFRTKAMMKLSIVVIAVLSAFLGLQIVMSTELENCYCFGETLQLSNTESLIKNAVMLLMTIVALRLGTVWNWSKFGLTIVGISMYALTALTISILNPPINIYEEFSIDTFNIGDDFPRIDSLDQSVYEGEVILGFFSPTCVHCKQAAMKMQVINEQESSKYQTIAVFGFGKKRIKGFMHVSKLTSEVAMIDKREFLKLTKGVFPQIYHLKDGKIQNIWNKQQFIKENL